MRGASPPRRLWIWSLLSKHFPSEWDRNNCCPVLIPVPLLSFGPGCVWREESLPMWCGNLRPVSVAPHGCQIARGKVIYTTDTVVAVGGKHPGVCRRSSLCHPGSHTSFMDGSNSAVKPLSAAGAAFAKCHFSPSQFAMSAELQLINWPFLPSSVQTKCIKFLVLLSIDVPAERHFNTHKNDLLESNSSRSKVCLNSHNVNSPPRGFRPFQDSVGSLSRWCILASSRQPKAQRWKNDKRTTQEQWAPKPHARTHVGTHTHTRVAVPMAMRVLRGFLFSCICGCFPLTC